MDLNLKAEKRDISGKKVQSLRDGGGIPAVVYGPETDNINLTVDYLDFEKVYKEAGESTLIGLKINEMEEMPVLVQTVSYNPVSDKIDHIDFYKIKYGQKLTARVELEFIGEPPAVKEFGGILVKSLTEVEIECLPKNLISKIEVDLTGLKTFDDSIHVKDLIVPDTIKILTGKDDIIASVSQPRIEEEKVVSSEEENGEESSDAPSGAEKSGDSDASGDKKEEASKE